MRLCKWKLPRHLSVSQILLARLPTLGDSAYYFSTQKQQTQAPLNGRSRGLYYTERGGGGGGEEEEEEGVRTASEVRDWHPTLILPVSRCADGAVCVQRGWKAEIAESVSVLG